MNDGQFVERGTLDLWDDTMREQRDRIEALTTERDAAYARGYSDAETEISRSALGQRNDFLHSQYANAADHIKVLTAERDRLREALRDGRRLLAIAQDDRIRLLIQLEQCEGRHE